MRGVGVFLFTLMASAASAQDESSAPENGEDEIRARGLLQFYDAEPLAGFHLNLPITTPEVLDEGDGEISFLLDWGSTFGSKPSQMYLVDAETVNLRLRYRRGVCDGVEIGAELPFFMRGNGIMDGFIETFHDLFGLPDGGRDDVSRNGYSIGLVTPQGTRTISQGTSIGDLSLWTKIELLDDDDFVAAAVAAGFKVPTGADDFGSGGVDVGASLNISRNICSLVTLYAGAGPLWFSDVENGALRFHRWNWQAYAGLEFHACDEVSVTMQTLLESPMLEDPANFDDTRYYWSIGLLIEPWLDGKVFEFGLVENIVNFESSADFTWHFGFRLPF